MENLVSTESTTARADALEAFGTAYQQVARAQRRLRGRDAMQPGRLTAPQVNLLQPLLENGPMSSGQLAEAAGLTPATTTHMLDQLAVSGVVERERQIEDKRVVITRLTPHGEEMLEARRTEMREAWDAALAELSVDELECATKAIAAVCTFVDDL
ncbi:MAG: MarR family winged helix-turn-helix transcriptional regulator [Solirubrobacterales bacterium]